MFKIPVWLGRGLLGFLCIVDVLGFFPLNEHIEFLTLLQNDEENKYTIFNLN